MARVFACWLPLTWIVIACGAVSALAAPEAPVAAEPAPAPALPAPAPAGAPGEVDLDTLLKLPSGLDYEVQTRGGETRGEWRSRFRTLRARLAHEKQALAEAEAKLAETAQAASQWTLAPPIPGAEAAMADAPLDFELRQDMKRHRQEIELIERQLQELEIEANLANVPPSWRE